MNRFTAIASMAVAALAAALLVGCGGSDNKGKRQTLCPVTGSAIDRSIQVDHDGKRVYFCCPGCVEAFKKSPDKYVRKLEADGVTLDTVAQPVAPKPAPSGG